MGWAIYHIKKLQAGKDVSFRPAGNSMAGIIDNGDTVYIEPVSKTTLPLLVGDIVLCKIKGKEYLHRIKAIKGKQYQIGNARGKINGWITMNAIYGVCTDIESKGSKRDESPIKMSKLR